MNLLLDTHLLLWAAAEDDMISHKADRLIKDASNALWFSVASMWEVVIKTSLRRESFSVDANVLRAGLLSNGYRELPIEGRHCQVLTTLPKLHGDPFDRMLLAQAMAEGMHLVTADRRIAAYGGPVMAV